MEKIKKQMSKLYIATIQDENGKIQKILTGTNYEQIWLLATTESKSMRGYWTLFDFEGRPIDGNFHLKEN